ncbi:hypothetical protein O181_044824 [Austropuccinia psidii MF-1]|uniref:Helicase ATP-binding domain-containing protein n=1 Tax=Austropuccinia psidii MF-1 TaxID=1389203 RepID=A0A9Q3DL02_9BASI|nr:hypothetical protein [Austropuccinia psidii MF-1]
MPPNFIIKTKPLYHQAQGRYFLIDCESPDFVLAIAFWKRISSLSRILWQHKITNKTISTPNSDLHPPSPLESILADDMSLGESLQAISLVAHTLNSARNYQKSSLSTISGCQETIIVFPKRLIENWEEEINKHTHPNNLHVLRYHGSNCCKDFVIKSIQRNIIITAYETLRMDFRSTPKGPVYDYQWYRVILDEAHVIRNSHAHVHAAVMSLQTKNRLCLTGTPLNNSLSDYMSLFEFISCNQPWDGILQKHLEIGDLKPFHMVTRHLMLCQLKTVVLPSLPLICEEEVFRPLPSTIRLYYDRIFMENLSEYLYTDEAKEEKKKSKRRNLLVSIQQLRCLCNHLILAETTSSREEVDYSNFSEAQTGTGLNITCGQIVFIMDPHWNPSQESQAIDRLHRIGQSSIMKVFRFISQDTIEINIQRVQEHKKKLMRSTVLMTFDWEIMSYKRICETSFYKFKESNKTGIPPSFKIT